VPGRSVREPWAARGSVPPVDEIVVDLYSDTQTRPSAAMRRAIAEAEVGDEQQRRDPSVTRLCAEVASRLGQEAAMFLPSGTMCNAVAVATHTRPGDAVVLDRLGHIARSETGGAAVISGVMFDYVDGERGVFTAGQLAEVMPSGNIYRPAVTLVCLEQTHNFGGGTVWPLDTWRAVVGEAHDRGARVHVDGARLFNAVVASGVDATAWGAGVDSIWVDFTKGLGAPIGAVLAGPAAFIEAAWTWKHRLGGAMRQAGMAAAGCLYALEHNIDRLADDHANAGRLAEGLRHRGVAVDDVETNMCWIDPASVDLGADELVGGLRKHGVRVSQVGERVRAVTHLDVTADDVGVALDAVDAVLAR
jgi:threonine aldolase